MNATPTVTPPPLEEKPKVEERAMVVGYIAPAPEGYVTPTRLLSAAGSPSRPRTSPKRKQLSSPEGSEIAAGLVSAVKRHCGSPSEDASSPRLPCRMPYGASSRAKEEGPGVVGEGENQAPMLQKDGDPRTPPMTPGNTGDPPELEQEEESEDLLFATPPEGDKSSGTAENELAKAGGDMNGDLLDPSDENELVASRSELTPIETPLGPSRSCCWSLRCPSWALNHPMETKSGRPRSPDLLRPARNRRVLQPARMPKSWTTVRFHHSSGPSH